MWRLNSVFFEVRGCPINAYVPSKQSTKHRTTIAGYRDKGPEYEPSIQCQREGSYIFDTLFFICSGNNFEHSNIELKYSTYLMDLSMYLKQQHGTTPSHYVQSVSKSGELKVCLSQSSFHIEEAPVWRSWHISRNHKHLPFSLSAMISFDSWCPTSPASLGPLLLAWPDSMSCSEDWPSTSRLVHRYILRDVLQACSTKLDFLGCMGQNRLLRLHSSSSSTSCSLSYSSSSPMAHTQSQVWREVGILSACLTDPTHAVPPLAAVTFPVQAPATPSPMPQPVPHRRSIHTPWSCTV